MRGAAKAAPLSPKPLPDQVQTMAGAVDISVEQVERQTQYQ
jgi:hypothetical protein